MSHEADLFRIIISGHIFSAVRAVPATHLEKTEQQSLKRTRLLVGFCVRSLFFNVLPNPCRWRGSLLEDSKMLYREIQPTPALARFVECFWTLESDGSTAAAQPERLLPDGCVELILNLGNRFREHKDNGKEERQPQHLLVGQMTRPILIAPTGSVQLLGIRFHPGGTLPFFRIPMQRCESKQILEHGNPRKTSLIETKRNYFRFVSCKFAGSLFASHTVIERPPCTFSHNQ